MLAQAEVSDSQQIIAKTIENIRQQLLKFTFDVAQNISKVQGEIAEIGVKFRQFSVEK